MSEATLSPEEFQQQLEEKDQLIQMLTDRLSQAAEELDRKQRSGSSLGGRPTGPAGEMMEQQRQLLENLSTTLERWDDVQPHDAFMRIEARLDYLREILEAGAANTRFDQLSAAPSAAPSADDPKHQPEENQSDEDDTDEEPLSGWEAMKAQLLVGGRGSDEKAATDQPASSPASKAPHADVGEDSTDRTDASQAPTSLADLQLPQPVDFDAAERSDLEQAIDARDVYIGHLTRRLRREEQRTREAIDWEAITNAPDELREKLQSLEADLEERLRIAEVDLSLERARLSRVQSRTEELQREIEERVKSNQKRARSAEVDEAATEGNQGTAKGWLANLRLK